MVLHLLTSLLRSFLKVRVGSSAYVATSESEDHSVVSYWERVLMELLAKKPLVPQKLVLLFYVRYNNMSLFDAAVNVKNERSWSLLRGRRKFAAARFIFVLLERVNLILQQRACARRLATKSTSAVKT